jgi:hypothetical protein
VSKPTEELHMIVWASGLIEFIRDLPEPEGAIHCCTARGEEAISDLLDTVREQSVLHCFTDTVGLRVPEINPTRTHIEFGPDAAVDLLMRWEDYVRDLLGLADLDIDWMRA